MIVGIVFVLGLSFNIPFEGKLNNQNTVKKLRKDIILPQTMDELKKLSLKNIIL